MLEIKNLKKKYKLDGNNYEIALKGISTKFTSKDFGIILGESGSGKSTFLNIISGLDTDFEGEVLFNGKSLKDINIDIYHKNSIGFIFQSFNLVPHMTILENVKQPLYISNELTEKEKNARSKELLESVGLGEFIKKLPGQLSGGQKQRVAIARSLANNPDIIIADEPTGALDSETSDEVISLLKNLADKGKTVIVVTHDQSLRKFATKVVKLKDGLVVEEDIIKDNPEIKEEISNVKPKLSFLNLIKLAWRNFKNRKLRNIIVALGTSIGIIAILVALGIGNGINTGIESILNSSMSPNQITVSMKTDVPSGPGGTPLTKKEQNKVESTLKAEKLNENYPYSQLIGVKMLFEGEEIKYENGMAKSITKANFKPKRYEKYTVKEDYLSAGKMVEKDSDGIVLDSETAKIILKAPKEDKLKKGKAEKLIGKKITVSYRAATEEDVEEVKYDTVIRGVLNEDNETVANQFMGLHISEKSFDGIIEKAGKNDQVLGYIAFTSSPDEAQRVVNKYKDKEDSKIIVENASTMLASITDLTNIIVYLLSFIAGLSLIVAGVMIAIVLYIGVIERTREIGVLRALGYKKSNISSLFITEAIYIIIFSNIISIAISKLIETVANKPLESILGFENVVMISPGNMFTTLVITLIVGIVFAIYPSYKGAKLDPANALRYE